MKVHIVKFIAILLDEIEHHIVEANLHVRFHIVVDAIHDLRYTLNIK
jgi:hypothetical protein